MLIKNQAFQTEQKKGDSKEDDKYSEREREREGEPLRSQNK